MEFSATDLLAYDYDLPPDLIAQEPANPRDSSRLMVLHRAERRWEHRKFTDLPLYLDQNDLIIANNTQVLKARLQGRRLLQKSGPIGVSSNKGPVPSGPILSGKVEFVLLEELKPNVWEGLIHASARALPGLSFEIPTPDGKGLRGTLIERPQQTGASPAASQEAPTGTVVAEFDRDPIACQAGTLPLPHYIQTSTRIDSDSQDSQYQTVYAKNLGSAAAPTAGLHFTPNVIQNLRERGVQWEEVTLHVGVGTFRPVKSLDIRNHKMHEERYEISKEVANRVTQWKAAGRRILAVGTTSVRTLESAWEEIEPGKGASPGGLATDCQKGSLKGQLRSGPGRTSLFIRPEEFQFKVADRLLTNFHLPRSTLLMLVSAFADREFVLQAYQEAIRQKYRFFSFGDALLIL